jgi:hypothetical protein
LGLVSIPPILFTRSRVAFTTSANVKPQALLQPFRILASFILSSGRVTLALRIFRINSDIILPADPSASSGQTVVIPALAGLRGAFIEPSSHVALGILFADTISYDVFGTLAFRAVRLLIEVGASNIFFSIVVITGSAVVIVVIRHYCLLTI